MSDHSSVRYLVCAAAFVIVVAGMKAAASILVPLLFAVFLAIVCAQPIDWLIRKRVPRWLALAIVIGTVTLTSFSAMVFVGASVGRLITELPNYEEKLQKKKSDAVDWWNKKDIRTIPEADLNLFNPGTGVHLFRSVLIGLSNVLSNAFTILLLWAFLLPAASNFPEKIHQVAGADAARQMEDVVGSVQQYVSMKTFISLVTGTLITLWLWILGVSYPFLWGSLAFLMNFIPNVGSLMAAVPAVVFAMIQLGLAEAAYAAAGYLVVNGVLGNVVEPRVMGQGLGLSAFVILVSLVFWGWVMGSVGMLLAVPLTMTVKIVLESSEETRWLASLMGSDTRPQIETS